MIKITSSIKNLFRIYSSKSLKILGIETSCDDTCVAIIDSDAKVYSNLIKSQYKHHEESGGIVPTIAGHHHSKNLPDLINKAFTESRCTLENIDLVAVTRGPGLSPGGELGGADRSARHHRADDAGRSAARA